MTTSSDTYYQILGVPPGVEHDVLKDRYRGLVRLHHPDAGGDTEAFARMTEAGSVLLDPDKRRLYDIRLRMERTACASCKGSGQTWVQRTFAHRFPYRCRTCDGVGYV